MGDDSLYLSTREGALAVVATAMKKSRQLFLTLCINSLMGGIFFSSGGMLNSMIYGYSYLLVENNPSIVRMLQGLMYPIGLFYVAIMGVDLFNSNILFFSTGLVRGAVSIVDLLISLMVSWWLNLVGNIFVCYVICHYSKVSQDPSFVQGSIELVIEKADFSFVQNLLKGIAGNFYVALAIYLQLMAKPLHVKFILLALPVFTLVSMGFTHSVADMFTLISGLINHAPVSVATVAWKVFLPGALGNIIGGSFFGIVIVWYLHLYVVEQDMRKLNLPEYEARDEQPELNMDSRVVRQKSIPEEDEKAYVAPDGTSTDTSAEDYVPQTLYPNEDQSRTSLRPTASRRSTLTRFSTAATNRSFGRSPKNVFPVYGMGEPLEREKSIASGTNDIDERLEDNDATSVRTSATDYSEPRKADFIGSQLKRIVTRRSSSARKSSSEAEEEP